MFCFIGHKACGIFVPWPGMEPASLTLEGKALTTGLPVKYCVFFCLFFNEYLIYVFTLSTFPGKRDLVGLQFPSMLFFSFQKVSCLSTYTFYSRWIYPRIFFLFYSYLSSSIKMLLIATLKLCTFKNFDRYC